MPPPKDMSVVDSLDGPELLRAAYRGEIDRLRGVLSREKLRTVCDPQTGLNLLHIAVGTNNLELTRFLAEEVRVPFKPDAKGRWPSVIAAECSVSETLGDYIVETEAAFINAQAEAGLFLGQSETDQPGLQKPGSFFPKR